MSMPPDRFAGDTIAAIATPPGRGGIGVVRISGPESLALLNRLFVPASASFAGFVPWKLHHGRLRDCAGRILDDALAVFMPGPDTFTGEDVAELHCHGGPAVLAGVLDEVLCSARLAERGEFSRRAFLNGRMDLSQAEAVAELIAAPTKEGARLAAGKIEGLLGRRVSELRELLENLRARLCLAVDFPDDEVEPLPRDVFVRDAKALEQAVSALLAGVERTRCWREGVSVALAGAVNAGKSSLMNAFLGRPRAIVAARPGTTRDFLEEPLNLDGLSVRLVDTAGLRGGEEPDDPVESEGIRMGLSRVREADVVVLLVDGERGLTPETVSLAAGLEAKKLILVWNKMDLAAAPDLFLHGRGEWEAVPCAGRCAICARSGQGVDELARLVRKVVLAGLGARLPEPGEIVPNARQARELETAREALAALRVDARDGLPYELCAVRLEETARALDNITGADAPEDVLNRIFDTFCVGK